MPTKTTKQYVNQLDIVNSNGTEIRTSRPLTLESSITGVENPDWKADILNNRNATTALTAIRRSFSSKPLSGTGIYVGNTGLLKVPTYIKGLWLGDLPAWTVSLSITPGEKLALKREAQSLARTYAFRRLAKYQDPLTGAQETLGEIRETVGLLRNPLHTLTNLTRNLAGSIEGARALRGRRQDAALKNLGEAVLEFNFGVAPLLMTISEVKDVLEDHLLEYHEKNRMYGASAIKSTTSTGIITSSSWEFDTSTTHQYYAECFLRFGILLEKLKTHDELLNSIPDEILQVRDLPRLMWEFTPLSVFVDYIVNVGDIIQASFAAQSAVSYSSESTVFTMIKKVILSKPRAKSGALMKSDPFYTDGEAIYKTREVERIGGNIGIPPMVYHLPGHNVSYMNIAALILASQFTPNPTFVKDPQKGLKKKSIGKGLK